MCIKTIYHNVYVDGEKDVTERIDACRSGHICSDPIVIEFDRKINCTRQQLSVTPARTESPSSLLEDRSRQQNGDYTEIDQPSKWLKGRQPMPYHFDYRPSLPYGGGITRNRASHQRLYIDRDRVTEHGLRMNRRLTTDDIVVQRPSITRRPQVESFPQINQASDPGRVLDWDGVNAKLESESEAAPGGNIGYSSDLYETSSVQSYNNSIFDEIQSVLSSVSSLGNDTQTVFVGAFVDLLLRDPSIDRMIARATSDAGIGAERFRRSFSRILKTYSRDLRDTIGQQQQNKHKHQRVATFISRKATQASSLVVTRYKERTPRSDNNALDKVEQDLDGLDSENSDSSHDEEPDTEPTIVGLETFLLQGKPFKALQWHLRSLIIPSQCMTQVQHSTDRLLNFMFYSLWLEQTFARAYERVPNFDAWLRLMIDALAESLEIELKAGSPATEYLRTYSGYISAQIVRKLRQNLDVSDAQDPAPSSLGQDDSIYSTELKPSQEILEDIMAERLPEVFGREFLQKDVWPRLLSKKAFRDFLSDISDTAYPTFFSECRKALNAEIDSQGPHPSAESEERYLLSTLKELQCSAQYSQMLPLSIESPDSVLWVDRLKLAIEKSTASEWNWWPLSPPPRAERKAHAQLETLDQHARRPMQSREFQEPSRSQEHADSAKILSWRCTCGYTRREIVSLKYANLFQQLASEYPAAHHNNSPIQLNRLPVPQTRSQSSSGDSSSSVDTQSVKSSGSTDEGSRRASVQTAPSSTGSTTITLEFDTQAFIHLLVRKAGRYVLSPMDVTHQDARDFFQDLIIRYHQHRGLLRRIFSIFVYSHCDFVKVNPFISFKDWSIVTNNAR